MYRNVANTDPAAHYGRAKSITTATIEHLHHDRHCLISNTDNNNMFYETYERYTWVKHICTGPYLCSSPALQNRSNADWHTAWCSGHRLWSTGLCAQR